MESRLSIKWFNNAIQSWIIFEKINASMTNSIRQRAPKH